MQKSKPRATRSDEHPQIEIGDFFKSINAGIRAGEHAEYLKRVLENFLWYQKAFQDVFTLNGSSDAVYLFHVTYKNKADVWRDIEMIGSQTFEHLAKKIVSTMNWAYDHMHGFTIPGAVKEAKDDVPFETNTELVMFHRHWEDDPFPTYKSNEIMIHQLDYQKYPRLEFIFDYGDGHQFEIEYQGQRDPVKMDRYTKFPKLVDLRGVAPEQYPLIEEDIIEDDG